MLMPAMWHNMAKGLMKKGKSESSAYAIATSAYEKKTGKTPQGKPVSKVKRKKK